MEIRRDLTSARPPNPGTALTIGAYDGVHLGHRQVIGEVCRLAVEDGLVSAVVTFDRHPATVIRPGSAPLLLTDLEQKLEQLATTGVDLTQVVTFDQARAVEDAEVFVAEVLVEGLGVRVVVVGEDFHFGRQRQGNVDLLRRMGADLGFEVYALGLVGTSGAPARDHEQVSSTFIRRALAAGDLDWANDMLGRPYEVRGIAEHGSRRHRDVGLSTTNVGVDRSILLPAAAVYAGYYERPNSEVYPATVSLGDPSHSADDGQFLLKVHLLDFEPVVEADLYEEEARVRFVRFLRPQQSFDSSDDLAAQLRLDLQTTRTVVA